MIDGDCDDDDVKRVGEKRAAAEDSCSRMIDSPVDDDDDTVISVGVVVVTEGSTCTTCPLPTTNTPPPTNDTCDGLYAPLVCTSLPLICSLTAPSDLLYDNATCCHVEGDRRVDGPRRSPRRVNDDDKDDDGEGGGDRVMVSSTMRLSWFSA